MAQPFESAEQVRFSGFTLDCRTGELSREGKSLKLQPQPAKILRILVLRAGQAVSREELAQGVWGSETFVDFEHGLNFAIRRIRTVLEDDADEPRFIETLPKRGYRFIAPVTIEVKSGDAGLATGAAETPQLPPHRAGHSRRSSLLLGTGVAVLALVLLGAYVFRNRTAVGSSALPIRSIAVLPLQNLSGDPSQEYFADGMTDELTSQLAKIRALRVTSRTSAIRYKNTQKSLGEIARELHVDAVVEGSVVRSGNRVRITAQLVDTRSDAHVWAEKYEDDLRDILVLQSDVAEKIARNIGVTLSTSEQLRLKSGAPVDPVAHETYLKGIFYWNRLSCDGFEKALSFFQQSVNQDPNFALAYSGMADSYFNLADWACRPQEETYPKFQAAALKAAALDPFLAGPHTALGELAFYHEWNWSKADSEFRRALDLDPSDAGNHTSYGIYLISMGKQREALEQWRIARELDPVSEITSMLGSYIFYLAHDYDQAIEQGRKTLELYPRSGSVHYWMGQAYEQKGMYAEAVDNYLSPKSEPGPKLEFQRLARKAFAEKGMRGYWMNEFHKKIEGNLATPCWETLIYAHLKDKDKTLQHLEDGFEHHCDGLQFLKVEPVYDFLRQEPRYKALLQRLGL